ncbi:MAG: arsenical pump-driving ATPase GET3 [Methanobrevibacter sp.]|jgi:arsenite-transporting ATPase|nr:arsenical pump-driving ATPase GET3 [Methanobrevibacter sp.]
MGIEDLLKFKEGRTRFVFVGGKGGVGKTSISAATGIWLAKHNRKTLLISTDPTHSLSDSLETCIGSKPTFIMSNLDALEIDPDVTVPKQEEKLKNKKSDDSQQAMGSDMVENQLDLASSAPGSDEDTAFEVFIQVITTNEYDVIIFDTAPTGNSLRFLSFPDLIGSWVGKVLKVKYKLSSVKNTIKNLILFADEDKKQIKLDETKIRIEIAQKIMSDPEQTTFKMVVIPEETSIYESEKGVESLKKHDMNVDSVIVNQVILDTDNYNFSQSRYKIQEKCMELINQKFHDQTIFQIPLFKGKIKGINKLGELGQVLYENKSVNQLKKDAILL